MQLKVSILFSRQEKVIAQLFLKCVNNYREISIAFISFHSLLFSLLLRLCVLRRIFHWYNKFSKFVH